MLLISDCGGHLVIGIHGTEPLELSSGSNIATAKSMYPIRYIGHPPRRQLKGFFYAPRKTFQITRQKCEISFRFIVRVFKKAMMSTFNCGAAWKAAALINIRLCVTHYYQVAGDTREVREQAHIRAGESR